MKGTTMRAFTKDIKKREFLAEVKRHRELDMIVQGTYGKTNGKWLGCARQIRPIALRIHLLEDAPQRLRQGAFGAGGQ